MTVHRRDDDPLERLSIAPTRGLVTTKDHTARVGRSHSSLPTEGSDFIVVAMTRWIDHAADARRTCANRLLACSWSWGSRPERIFAPDGAQRTPAGGVASGAISTGTYGSALRWRTGPSRGCASGLPARSRTASAGRVARTTVTSWPVGAGR
jgi:hypothetical protein